MSISLDFLAFAFCLLVEGIRNRYKIKNQFILSCKSKFVSTERNNYVIQNGPRDRGVMGIYIQIYMTLKIREIMRVILENDI